MLQPVNTIHSSNNSRPNSMSHTSRPVSKVTNDILYEIQPIKISVKKDNIGALGSRDKIGELFNKGEGASQESSRNRINNQNQKNFHKLNHYQEENSDQNYLRGKWPTAD